MATLDEIGQERQRISERLARLDAERTKLGDQLNELEIAERVPTRFGGKTMRSAGTSTRSGARSWPCRPRTRGVWPNGGVRCGEASPVEAHDVGERALDERQVARKPAPEARAGAGVARESG